MRLSATLAMILLVCRSYKHTQIFFFWAGSVGTYLASQKSPPEHRLRLLLAGLFQLFFAFYTFFVLVVPPCSGFLYVYVASVSSCTRAAVVATWQPTAIQQQHHNKNSSRYIHTAVVRLCRPERDYASKHAWKIKSSIAESQPCTSILCFFFSSFSLCCYVFVLLLGKANRQQHLIWIFQVRVALSPVKGRRPDYTILSVNIGVTDVT